MATPHDYDSNDYDTADDFYENFGDETLRVRTRANDRERNLELRREIERRHERRRVREELGLDSLDI
jgi:hypothetical protein